MNSFLIKLIVEFLSRWTIPILIIVSLLLYAYYSGKQSVQQQWDLEKIKTEKLINELKVKQSLVNERIVVEYRDRVQVIREKAQERTRYVHEYITPEIDNQCNITNNVVGLLNSAIEDRLPTTTEYTDATPSSFTISDITQNTIDNYATCHEYREQIIQLQNWIREQNAIK